MDATAMTDKIPIKDHQKLDGDVECVIIGMDNGSYACYRALPGAITFRGRLYGKSSWNSDKDECCYRTDKAVATIA